MLHHRLWAQILRYKRKRYLDSIKIRKMKLSLFFGTLVAAENSLILGTEQQKCGGVLCGAAGHRCRESQVCMRVDKDLWEFYGSSVGTIGSERCYCITALRWHQSKGRNLPVVASKSPECAYTYLDQALNIVPEEAGATLASDENTEGRC